MGDKVRQSNMELLRLVAMFLILLLHANNTVFNYLTPETVLGSPGYALPFLGVESLANVGVDVFVLISGWFGIRARLKGGLSILFQPFFWSVIILLFCLIADYGAPLHPKSLANVFLFTKNYWYIKAYLGLYILSPVLNSFVEAATKKQFAIVVILFYVFQTVYGCSDSAPDFHLGYSIVTFSGLYLLARYIRLYGDIQNRISRLSCVSIFIITTILLTGMVFISYRLDTTGALRRGLLSYCDPLVIVQSLSLLLLFNQFRIKSGLINRAAISCLSVYLIHENVNLQEVFRDTAHSIYTNGYFFSSLGMTLIYLFIVFVVSILMDQLRILVWGLVEKTIQDVSYSDLK